MMEERGIEQFKSIFTKTRINIVQLLQNAKCNGTFYFIKSDVVFSVFSYVQKKSNRIGE